MCIICHIYTDIYLHGDSTTEELISHYYWLLVVNLVEYLMTIPQKCSTSPNEARVKGIWSFGWPCGGVLHIRWIIIRLCIVITIVPENNSIGSHIYRHVYAYTFTYEYTYTCTVTCTYTFTHTHTYTYTYAYTYTVYTHIHMHTYIYTHTNIIFVVFLCKQHYIKGMFICATIHMFDCVVHKNK